PLGAQRGAIIRIALIRPSLHNQVAVEGAGNAHLHAKLVRPARLALADAVHLRSVPGVQLGLAVDGLALGALSPNTLGLAQHLVQCLAHRLTDHTGFAVDLRSEEHTSERQSRENLVCRLLLEKKKDTERSNRC